MWIEAFFFLPVFLGPRGTPSASEGGLLEYGGGGLGSFLLELKDEMKSTASGESPRRLRK